MLQTLVNRERNLTIREIHELIYASIEDPWVQYDGRARGIVITSLQRQSSGETLLMINRNGSKAMHVPLTVCCL